MVATGSDGVCCQEATRDRDRRSRRSRREPRETETTVANQTRRIAGSSQGGRKGNKVGSISVEGPEKGEGGGGRREEGGGRREAGGDRSVDSEKTGNDADLCLVPESASLPCDQTW